VNVATSGCTRSKLEAAFIAPDSRTTVGTPAVTSQCHNVSLDVERFTFGSQQSLIVGDFDVLIAKLDAEN